MIRLNTFRRRAASQREHETYLFRDWRRDVAIYQETNVGTPRSVCRDSGRWFCSPFFMFRFIGSLENEVPNSTRRSRFCWERIMGSGLTDAHSFGFQIKYMANTFVKLELDVCFIVRRNALFANRSRARLVKRNLLTLYFIRRQVKLKNSTCEKLFNFQHSFQFKKSSNFSISVYFTFLILSTHWWKGKGVPKITLEVGEEKNCILY